ncbi:DUF4282 domain-containing protein [Changpingibacter yushuensis]|uniref:DUF4282 domain-containing protein n=1 Tax=Changpingibacter yushuensis TaxID=2758440 RepID=UPI0015F6AD3B|nr:DUF4282 domain-containing protein [Changpingibacter yushuensis]
MTQPPVPHGQNVPSGDQPTGGGQHQGARPQQPFQQPSGQPYGQPYGQTYGQQASGQAWSSAPMYPQPTQDDSDKGFFGALFDFEFKNFVTIKVVKIVYIVVIVLAVLAWIAAVISGASRYGFLGFLGALVFGGVGAFLYILLARVGLEVSIALIRTAQNTSKIVEKTDKK